MWRKLLAAFGLLAYLAVVALVFAVAAYLSFSFFVRSGATRAPEIAGLSLDEAGGLLSDQGLEMRIDPDGRYSTDVPVDHVVQQDPDAGDLVKRGSPVTVVPSLGPQQIEVPDLAGQGLPSAQVLLAASGLELGRTLRIFAQRVDPGTVVEQRPQAGEAASPNLAVDVLVALAGATESFVMPDLVYRDLDTVRAFFERHGFRLGTVKYERYEGVDRGVVLRQFPLAGHEVSRTEAVSLVVAAGVGPDPFDDFDDFDDSGAEPDDDFGGDPAADPSDFGTGAGGGAR